MTDLKTLVLRSNSPIIRKEKLNPEVFHENNKVIICGVLEKEFEYSHTSKGKEFYKNTAIVMRGSGVIDYIPIIVPENLIEIGSVIEGKWAEIYGYIISRNRRGEDKKRHLDIFVFVTEIRICKFEELKEKPNTNVVYIDAYICKPPSFKITPLQKYEITSIILSVNRANRKTDYIPCIIYGKEAKPTAEFEVENRIVLCGKLQSKEFEVKNMVALEEKKRIKICEVSVNRLERLKK